MSEKAPTITTSALSQVQLSYQTTADYGVVTTVGTGNSAQTSKTTYADGTGSGQVHREAVDTYTVTPASGTLDIDLTALTDNLGLPWSASKVKILYVYNHEPATGANLKVGDALTNAWTAPFAGGATSQVTVGPTDELFLTNKLTGFTVDSTHKILRFTHDGSSSGNIVFDLWILGY